MNVANAKFIAKEFLRKVEGLELVGKDDIGGVSTNGYGNTHGAILGVAITKERAEFDLDRNIDLAELNLTIHRNCDDLDNHEGAALISFVFNAGAGNWQIWKCPKDQIVTQLMRFDHARIDGKLVEIKGLANRREAEVSLWNTGDTDKALKDTIINTSDGTYSEREIAPNHLDVAPRPDPAKQIKADSGIKAVATTVVASLPIAAIKLSGFGIALPYIIGFTIGCAFCLALGAVLYYFELRKPKQAEIRWLKPSEPPQLPQWIKDLLMTSQAFQDALAALVKAFQDQQASAVAAATKAATETADADAVAALAAATPVAASPDAPA